MDMEKQRVLDLAHLLMLGEFTLQDYEEVISELLITGGYIARTSSDYETFRVADETGEPVFKAQCIQINLIYVAVAVLLLGLLLWNL